MPPKSTKEFLEIPGYAEAKRAAGYMYIGRKEDLKKLYEFRDLNSYRESSHYYGCMFYPDPHFNLHPELKRNSYIYNKALVAGAIDAGRPFILISDLATESGALSNGYTGDELFWLQDNGYTFKPNPDNPLQTLAMPPTELLDRKYIRDYNKEQGYEPHGEEDIRRFNLPCEPLRKKTRTLPLSSAERKPAWTIRTARFNILKAQVLAERERLLASRATAPTVSASSPEELHRAVPASNTVDVVSALSRSPCATEPVPKPGAPISSATTPESKPKDKQPLIDPSIPQQPPP